MLQVSIHTKPNSSGGKMGKSFMRVWTEERSCPTMMGPSRFLLIWIFHQSNLRTGGATIVCFSSVVWIRTSSPDWTEQWSEPMKVSLHSEVMKVRSTHLVYCNIIVHSKGQFMQFHVLKTEQFCQFISHLKSRLGHVSHLEIIMWTCWK